MNLIWYNPNTDRFQFGPKSEYISDISWNEEADRFEILHEFELGESEELISKICSRLNHARSLEPAKVFA